MNMTSVWDPRRMKRSGLAVFGRRRDMLCLLGLGIFYIILVLDMQFLRNCKEKTDFTEQELYSNISVYERIPSAVESRFATRKQHLKQHCENKTFVSRTTDYEVRSHMIVDEKYHVAYCYIEKVGCTFWKRVFQILNGVKNVTDPFQTRGMEAYGGYNTLEKMSFYKINNILRHSKTFMFVREPYERLLSGYVDKMLLPIAPYWLDLGKYIVDKFRLKTNVSAESCGDDVTFEEFVRYFIYSRENDNKKDVHFNSNYDHCRPCDIEYDYIGKLETFKEDTEYILEAMKLNEMVQVKDFERESEKDAIEQAVDWSYTVQKMVDNCIPRTERIFRTYRMLQIRGMISRDIPFPLTEQDGSSIDINKYKQMFLDVHARSGPAEVRKRNRREAFMEAYASLPPEILAKLQAQLNVDAELFEYEIYPAAIKAASTYHPSFRFFDLRRGP